MQNVELYRRKIKNADDLKSIVRTMKIMSSVSIQQFEQAAESLGEYFNTVEMGLHIVLNRTFQEEFPYLNLKENGKTGIIIFGSSQGLCGSFDEQIIEFTHQEIQDLNVMNSDIRLFALGERVAGHFRRNFRVDKVFSLPGSVAGINDMVTRLLLALDEWIIREDTGRILICHNKPILHGRYLPRVQHLLPLDQHWLKKLADKEWPTNNIPQYTMNSAKLFSRLVRQYLLVSFYRATAESMAAEHISRLNAMSVAEQKIKERLRMLKNRYAEERQNTITEELLDILSGYEAVKGNV